MNSGLPSLKSRLMRLLPYFEGTRLGFILAITGSLIGAATEPMIPALMKPLLDTGFKSGALPLWLVPVAVIGLFAIRGIAGFVAQYGLAWSANRGVLNLRSALFERVLTARPALFTSHTASRSESVV